MQESACVLTDAGPSNRDTQRSTPVLAEVGRDRSKTWVEASNEELSSGCQKRSARSDVHGADAYSDQDALREDVFVILRRDARKHCAEDEH